MTPERWRQLEELFQQALDRDASRQDAFLQKACAGDEDLRRSGIAPCETSDREGFSRADQCSSLNCNGSNGSTKSLQ
jgi:hypothetical protein